MIKMIETIEIVMTILAQILISLCWYKLGELKEGNRNRKDINKVFELTNSILETLDRNYKLKLILKETKIVSLEREIEKLKVELENKKPKKRTKKVEKKETVKEVTKQKPKKETTKKIVNEEPKKIGRPKKKKVGANNE